MATEEELSKAQEAATFLEGLRFWASQRDPVSFNTWQVVVSQMRKHFPDDPDLPSGPDYAQKVSSWWNDVMIDTHGPDWKKGIARPSGPAVPVAKSQITRPAPRAPALSSAPAEESQIVPHEPSAEVGAAVIHPPLRRLVGLGTRSEDLPAVPGSPGSASGRLEKPTDGALPFQFSVDDPGGGRAESAPAGSVKGSGLPEFLRKVPSRRSEAESRDHGPQIACVISQAAGSMAEAYRPEGSETTEACHDRLDRLKEALEDLGLRDEEIELTLQSEYYFRTLEEVWRESRGEFEDGAQSFREWALTQLTEHSFEEAQDCGTLEAQVRALCAVLNYSYERATSHVNRIWFSTPLGSAGMGSKRTSDSRSQAPRPTTFSTPTPQKTSPGSGPQVSRDGPAYRTPPRAPRNEGVPSAGGVGGSDPLPRRNVLVTGTKK